MTDKAADQQRAQGADKRAARARWEQFQQLLFRGGPLIALVLLVVFLSFATPYFLTGSNVLNVLRQSSFTAILAIGQTFVILTGGIDLSVAAIAALSASIGTVLLTQPVEVFGLTIGPLHPVLGIGVAASGRRRLRRVERMDHRPLQDSGLHRHARDDDGLSRHRASRDRRPAGAVFQGRSQRHCPSRR